jgi:uncharacterized protein
MAREREMNIPVKRGSAIDTSADNGYGYGTESIDPLIDCDSCDAVCCRLTVWLMPDDRDVPEWLVTHDDAGHTFMAKDATGWCAAIDPVSFRCSIYEQRPQLCRNFCMGGPACRDERDKWAGKATIDTPIVLTTG